MCRCCLKLQKIMKKWDANLAVLVAVQAVVVEDALMIAPILVEDIVLEDAKVHVQVIVQVLALDHVKVGQINFVCQDFLCV